MGTLGQTWQKLIRGESGIDIQQPFAEILPRPLALIDAVPADLDRLAQSAVNEAIADAGLALPLPDAGVVIGSSRAYQGKLESLASDRYFRRLSGNSNSINPINSAPQQSLNQNLQVSNWPGLNSQALSPQTSNLPASTSQTLSSPSLNLQSLNLQFLQALPCQLSTAIALQIGSSGPVLAPMAACATGLWAVAQAYELIQTGQCQQAIAGAAEAPITPLTLAGFQRMGALATTGAYPFDRGREGLVLGEGAAVFVLESAESAHQRGVIPYGQILGFGLGADGCLSNRPEPAGKSAISTITACLQRSGLTSEQIDYIHGHGTATPVNDAHEARLIHRLFPENVPVSSTKGATGHTLGASGAIGIALSCMALKQQILPPCVGLRDLEFDLDIVRTPRSGKVTRVLCLSFGFGGQNGAIILGTAP